MATLAHPSGPMLDRYRLPLFGSPDPLLARGLKIAGAIGLVVLAIGLLVPKSKVDDSIEAVPERVAKLILNEPVKPKPPAPKKTEVAQAKIEAPPPAPPMPKPEPVKAPPRADVAPRRQAAPVVPVDRGTEGRQRAQEATQQLAAATSSIDNVLSGLDQALDARTDAAATPRTPRRRGARSGRAASDVATAGALPAGAVSGSGSSALGGARIDVAAIGSIESDGGAPGGSGNGSSKSGVAGGTSDGELRSDASLLAVVRKYAPGIRFCYENELKKTPGLGGKLIVAITVAASGQVTNAQVVTDTIGSRELTSCALAQIEAWKFPAIPAGVVTFRAPFVFTPPE